MMQVMSNDMSAAASLGQSSSAIDPADLAAPCPCGLPRLLASCCARWWQGSQALQAPDAVTLMRSRYSAFVLGQTAYLLASWHASTRPDRLEAEPGLRWLGLTIGQSAQQNATHATVEFVARSKQAGRAHRLHETSRFVQEQGRWFYLDGDLHGRRRAVQGSTLQPSRSA